MEAAGEEEDSKGVATTRSAADGIYVISPVAAGEYRLRLSPSQAQRLDLKATPARSLTVTGERAVLDGMDFKLTVPE